MYDKFIINSDKKNVDNNPASAQKTKLMEPKNSLRWPGRDQHKRLIPKKPKVYFFLLIGLNIWKAK